MSMLGCAHAARLGLRGFGGVDLPDAAERAAALRWASILSRISRTLGSVVCSAASAQSESAAALRSAATLRRISRTLGSVVRSTAASAHALAKRRYLERVSMSMVGTSRTWGSLPYPRPFYAMVRTHCAK